MTYEEIDRLVEKRNANKEKVTLTEKEAEEYYGIECCDLIRRIYSFGKNNNYSIYQHATDLNSAQSIIQRGFGKGDVHIDSVPQRFLSSKPIYFESDEDGTKTYFYDGGPVSETDFFKVDELADTQHFFNSECNLDFGSLTNANVNRTGKGATCLFMVSNYVKGSRSRYQYCVTESGYDNFSDEEIPERYSIIEVIPRQYCLGYLDVKNKKFVFNPNFQFNFGIDDEFAMGRSNIEEQNLSNEIFRNVHRRH